MSNITLRDEIAVRLVAAGWNQKTFAHELGVSPAYMSDLLRGRRDLSAVMASKIGAALNLDGEGLFLRQAAETYRMVAQ